MLVRPDGTSYAIDARTGAVHRFDPEGRRVRIYRPNVDDYPGRLGLPVISVSGGGDVYISRRDRMNGQMPDYLHYAEDGRRLGVEQLPIDNITQAWLVQPDGRTRWVLGYEAIMRVDADGKVLRRIERDARRQWLLQPGPAALAPDGSLAVLSNNMAVHFARMTPGPFDGTIALYSSLGDALDVTELEQILRSEPFDELPADVVEVVGVLVFQDGVLTEHAVGTGVLGGSRLAGGGSRAGGFERVAAVGAALFRGDLRCSDHGEPPV
jgi:hypothetical protein